LKAIAYDQDGANTTSGTVTITVTNGNQPPTVSITSPANGATFTAPATVNVTASASDPENQLTKVEFYNGSTLLGTDTTSPYSFTWSNVAAGTYTLKAIAYDGAGANTTSATVTITVNASGQLPAGQSQSDIGSPASSGSGTYNSGTYTVAGGGTDVYFGSDQFHFVYQQMTGDLDVTARVATLTGADPWAKAGVMIRESLSADARNAFMQLSNGNGYRFTRRVDQAGATTSSGAGNAAADPYWVRLQRRGSQITGFTSPDGVTWTAVASDTLTMGTTVYVGLAVCAHASSGTATATFDNVAMQTVAGNQPPTVSLTSPSNGQTFTAPATVSISANASDPEGQLTKVEFYNGSTLLGTDTTSPYSFTWSNVAAGTYTLKAVAYDGAGASTQSATVTITVNSSGGTTPTTIIFTASADHNSSLVSSYLFEVFANGADPNTATPVASSDLGKPTPGANNDITVNRASFFSSLAPGTYVATVSAMGPGGKGRGAPVTFTR
jgi:regulation of enolase protein 1 (concanavalin A-like superfamily)